MTLEFSAVRASVAQAVKQAERARQLRIESIDRQLPALESDITTKQQEVAALRAERERLQAQTGHDLVAEILGPIEYRRVKNIPQALLDSHDGIWLDEAGDRVADMKPERRIRPRGTTFGALQTKAELGEAAEKKESGPLKFGDRVEVGFTAEDQANFDARWQHAQRIPAPVIFTSIEPQIGPVVLPVDYLNRGQGVWPFIGGESGHGAREFNPAWADRIVSQCLAAGVPVFVKQMGGNPTLRSGSGWGPIRDKKGGDPVEWPAQLRVRQIPEAAA